ncbi:MAG: hypothetical protein K8S21_04295 [Gemmatimonadetes bacterium]|nr:hypothetical protein [Gemmatimonadota bacterium]
MPILYYWKREQFTSDNAEPPRDADLVLSQDSARLVHADGQRMWIVSCDFNGKYVLVAQLTIDRSEERGNPLGRYTVIPRAGSTRRYRLVNPTPDVESVIRQLSFQPTAKTLGHVFEGEAAVRELNRADDQLLDAFANGLKPATSSLPWRLDR